MNNLRKIAKQNQWRNILTFLFLALLTAFGVGKFAGVFDKMQHSVCFTISSSESGITQLFYSSRPGNFSEERSQSALINPGQQTVCFTIGTGEKFLRWDPNNKNSMMTVNNVSVNFWGLKQSYQLNQLQPSTSVLSTVNGDGDGNASYKFTNNDPQIYFTVTNAFSYLENGACTLILWLGLSVFLICMTHIFKQVFINKNPAYLMGVLTVFALIFVYHFTGNIAVNNGAGWDGHNYLELLILWKNTGIVPNDPYRISRVIGFLPLVLTEFVFGLSISKLIILQTILNIIGIGVAVGFFMEYLLRCGLSLKRAYQFSIALLLTWPVLVMPTYYPMLSDHLAIILTCISLWCHVERRFLALTAICIISPFVMPGYFLVPFILLCLCNEPQNLTALSRFSLSLKWRVVIFIGLATSMPLYIISLILKIEDDTLLHQGSYLTPALLDLRVLSTIFVVAFLVLISWAWSNQTKKNAVFSHFSFKWSFAALGACAIGHALLYFSLDWNSGFKGPPLIENMLYQALNAPLKPLVAHSVFFGPIFAASLLILLGKDDSTHSRYAPKAVLYVFLPILALGSESRQWISVLPLFFALVAQANIDEHKTRLILWFSTLLALPLFWLAKSVASASSSNLPISDFKWQLYFGRQGPWMSQPVYMGALLVMLAFMILWIRTTTSLSKKVTPP